MNKVTDRQRAIWHAKDAFHLWLTRGIETWSFTGTHYGYCWLDDNGWMVQLRTNGALIRAVR